MIFSLQKIRNNSPYAFSETVDVSGLIELDNDIRDISPVNVSGEVSMSGHTFTFRYTIEGEMVLPCARTLVDVPYTFKIQSIDRFSTEEYQAANDEDIEFVDREVLDLLPYIKENILLEVPIRVFSEKAISNDFSKDGNGWNLFLEEEHNELKAEQAEKEKEKIDPRLASLKKFYDEKDD
ncbi:YceD family protein [Bacillaceae bacterium W0354]